MQSLGPVAGIDDCPKCGEEVNYLRLLIYGAEHPADESLMDIGYTIHPVKVNKVVVQDLGIIHLSCDGIFAFRLRDGVIWDRRVTCGENKMEKLFEILVEA